MSNTPAVDREERVGDAGHLQDLPDGCGCAEVWEHLSEGRTRDEE